jgi:hypothetical protein
MAGSFDVEKTIQVKLDASGAVEVAFEITELSHGRADIFHRPVGGSWSKSFVTPTSGDVDNSNHSYSTGTIAIGDTIALTAQVRPHYQSGKYRFRCWLAQSGTIVYSSNIVLSDAKSTDKYVYLLVKYEVVP